MENMTGPQKQEKSDSRSLRTVLSYAVCFICIVLILLPSLKGKDEKYPFLSAENFDPDAERQDYLSGGSNESLYRYLLALCRERYLNEETFDSEAILDPGRELYARAKAGSLDLETIGVTDDTIALLGVLREYGISP